MAEQEFTTEELATEEWRVVAAYPCYMVSNLGRIKRGQKLLKISYRREYPEINFSLGRRHQARKRKVHIIVAEAFLGPRPDRRVINHMDGNKANARLVNLEYVTHEENCRHAIRIGLGRRRTNHSFIIKSLHGAGVSVEITQAAFRISSRRLRKLMR